MRTIGFRSNILFAIAAACGVIAALGRPWYGPSVPGERPEDCSVQGLSAVRDERNLVRPRADRSSD